MTVPEAHQCATDTYTCPKCKTDIEISCGGEIGRRENAYCDDCRIEYTRTRTPIAEAVHGDHSLIIEKRRDEQPEYEEYECKDCGEMHENTTPGEFESQTPELIGRDETTLPCPCGEIHNGYLSVGESITCDCGRTYTLTMDSF